MSRTPLYFFRDPSPRPVGRLCYWGPECRDGRLYHAFSCPSDSTHGATHEYLVDMVTLETWCGCQWCRGQRLSKKGLAKYGPLQLLHPVSLCWHLNALSRWCKRKKKALKECRETAITANRIMAEQTRESAA